MFACVFYVLICMCVFMHVRTCVCMCIHVYACFLCRNVCAFLGNGLFVHGVHCTDEPQKGRNGLTARLSAVLQSTIH